MSDTPSTETESLSDRIRGQNPGTLREFAAGIVAIGEWTGSLLASILFAIGGVPLGMAWSFVGGVLKRLPKRSSMATNLATTGHKMLLGKSYDAIVHVIYGDGVVKPRPATYHSDEKAFQTANGETYTVAGIGFDPKRFDGKVPIVWGLRASNEITEPLEAAIANARELGAGDPIRDQDGHAKDVAVDISPNAMAQARGGQAVADGGAVNDYDGQVLSFRKGYELFGSKVTQEDMEDQEKRGKLAVLDMDASDQIKWGFLLIVAFLLGMFGPSLAAQVAGSAAGGVSGGGLGFGLSLVPGVP